MFPNWNDWNIQYTRKGYLKKAGFSILQFISAIFLALLVSGFLKGSIIRDKLPSTLQIEYDKAMHLLNR